MALYVPEMGGAGDLPDHCHMWPRGAVQVQEDTKCNPCNKASLNTFSQCDENC